MTEVDEEGEEDNDAMVAWCFNINVTYAEMLCVR
jgi:hypothetical protein